MYSFASIPFDAQFSVQTAELEELIVCSTHLRQEAYAHLSRTSVIHRDRLGGSHGGAS